MHVSGVQHTGQAPTPTEADALSLSARDSNIQPNHAGSIANRATAKALSSPITMQKLKHCTAQSSCRSSSPAQPRPNHAEAHAPSSLGRLDLDTACTLGGCPQTCGGLSTVRRRSPVSSGFFSRRMPNTRSAGARERARAHQAACEQQRQHQYQHQQGGRGMRVGCSGRLRRAPATWRHACSSG